VATGFRTPELDSLQKKGQWKSIAAAKTGAEAMRHELESIAIKMDLPADCSLVVFGSLARGEWTDGSDLDWVLLVDGQVSGAHYDAMLKLRQSFEQRHPGSTGTFGGLAFSHDLVHLIGGQDDTNRNLTLRMLLLLESAPVGGADAYNRVINALLDRYLIEPSSFSKTVTPRFLLNDLVRYWRTIAVDYADKFHDQAGAKAVLRNVKLRFSSKLI
jgi:predicted nucleotidyltransferase